MQALALLCRLDICHFGARHAVKWGARASALHGVDTYELRSDPVSCSDALNAVRARPECEGVKGVRHNPLCGQIVTPP